MKIDDTIKEYFRQGVKLFYDTGEARTMKETFERTIVHFFHQGWEWSNGVMVPILPSAEELPTLAQFRYWYGKEKGLQLFFKNTVVDSALLFYVHERIFRANSSCGLA